MREIGCYKLEQPIIYLGISFGGNPKSISFWEKVESNIVKRLES